MPAFRLLCAGLLVTLSGAIASSQAGQVAAAAGAASQLIPGYFDPQTQQFTPRDQTEAAATYSATVRVHPNFYFDPQIRKDVASIRCSVVVQFGDKNLLLKKGSLPPFAHPSDPEDNPSFDANHAPQTLVNKFTYVSKSSNDRMRIVVTCISFGHSETYVFPVDTIRSGTIDKSFDISL